MRTPLERNQTFMTEVTDAVRAIERRNGLRPGQHRHTWFITQNNPAEQIPECRGMSPEEIVRWAVDHCVHNAKGGPLRSRGVAVCYERGAEEHTDHIHIVLSFTGRNGGRASTVYRLWPKADIEVAKGTVEDFDAYLRKTGRFEGKGETVVEPVFDGEPLIANDKKKTKDSSDPTELSKRDRRWLEIRQAIEEGKTAEDIWKDPTLSLYAKDFTVPMERLLSAHAAQRPHKRSVTVMWVKAGRRSDDQAAPLEVVESAVRDWLEETGLKWGEWDLSLAAQPHVSADTEAVLVVIPRWGSSIDRLTVYQIMSGSPLRVAQGYGRGFWAAWTTIVVVCGDEPMQYMWELVSQCKAMPLGASADRMHEILSGDDKALVRYDELCALFDATADPTAGEGK